MLLSLALAALALTAGALAEVDRDAQTLCVAANAPGFGASMLLVDLITGSEPGERCACALCSCTAPGSAAASAGDGFAAARAACSLELLGDGAASASALLDGGVLYRVNGSALLRGPQGAGGGTGAGCGGGGGGGEWDAGPVLLRVGAACSCGLAADDGGHPGAAPELSCAQAAGGAAEIWLGSRCPEEARMLEPYQLAPDGTPSYPLSLLVQPRGPFQACLTDGGGGGIATWELGAGRKGQAPAAAAAAEAPPPASAWAAVWAARAAFSSAAAAGVAALLRRAGTAS
ncbi:hypothetical protein Rsub_05097 [Raphidocelis subcapitata]|uniref:Uncharacterized protein n=1 Tax=Raphidocelis subcapitata TaxID=307507 RepID=A0A2V0NYL1_9CHLO|nr:hypothetical protein Rsub_05097 [Raphidocelis subcapitata]|eukprot:GBF92728.1 hypothetical protein Rsub_05097 [Raphidocelis subcapitata]